MRSFPLKQIFIFDSQAIPSLESVSDALRLRDSVTEFSITCSRVALVSAIEILLALSVNVSTSKCTLSNGPYLSSLSVKPFCDFLRCTNNVQWLDCTNSSVCSSKIAIAQLAMAISLNTSLSTLILNEINLDANGAKMLAPAFQRNPFLTSLSLARNTICDTGLFAISQAMRFNCKLREINLDSNQLTSFGVGQFAMALRDNHHLEVLALSFNLICDQGALSISKSFKCLRKLSFQSNRIGSEGALLLLNRVSKTSLMSRLSFLDLRKNNLDQNYVVVQQIRVTKNKHPDIDIFV